MTDMPTLGPYEIRGELGRGAMAVVWRGYDPAIGRDIALKEPKIDDSLDPATREELVTRFIREGRTAGKLNHPGIVTIYNAEVIDGRPIIAMELIEGETLSALLRRGRLPVGAAIGIAEQLLDALSYAHARGVVHRDIKPDNVFVTDDGRVKLTDFGIAHVGAGTALTQAGTIMGTPGYMAPEQVRGETVDARADLFSVGVMLFEMLAGDNPFMADGAHPTTIMYRVLNEPLPDLRAALAEAGDGLPATIAVATAKDSAQRFGSAEDMRRALLGEVAVAMPKVARTEGGKSRIGWIAAAVTTAVVAVGLLGWVFWPGGRSATGDSPKLTVVDGTAVSSSEVPSSQFAYFTAENEAWLLDRASGSRRELCAFDEAAQTGDYPIVINAVWSASQDQLYVLVQGEETVIDAAVPSGKSSAYRFSVWAVGKSGDKQLVWADLFENSSEADWARFPACLAMAPGETVVLLAYNGQVSALAVVEGELSPIAQLPTRAVADWIGVSDLAWSPNGDRLAYLVAVETVPSEIDVTARMYPAFADWIGSSLSNVGTDALPAEGDDWPTVYDVGTYTGLAWSPDGSVLAASTESGIDFFDGSGSFMRSAYTSALAMEDSWQSVGDPAWSPTGEEILFSYGASLWALDVETGTANEVGAGYGPVSVGADW